MTSSGKLTIHVQARHPGLAVPSSPTKVEIEATLKSTKLSKDFACPICLKELTTKQSLKYHISHVHIDAFKKLNFGNADVSGPMQTVKPTQTNTKTVKENLKPRKSMDSSKIRIPCVYCKTMLSCKEKLKPHINSKHPGKRVPRLSIEKVSKKSDEHSQRKILKLQDPWQILWGGKELVYLKFRFRRPGAGARRSVAGVRRDSGDISVSC